VAEIQFVEEGHRYYFVDGMRHWEVPGVTRVIRDAGLIDERYYSAYHAHRGKMVHRMTALDDQGVLDEGSVDKALTGYLEAWRACKKALRFEVAEIEYMVGDEGMGYCGRVDRMLRIDNRLVPTDLKSGGREKWHDIQAALYVRGHERWQEYKDALIVYLQADGTFKLQPRKGMELLADIREGERLVRKFHEGGISLW
jgi:hypothetical protein